MIILLSLGLVLIVCITWKKINGGILKRSPTGGVFFKDLQLAVFFLKRSLTGGIFLKDL